MTPRTRGVVVVLAIVLCAGAAVLAAELGAGAAHGSVAIANPCRTRAPFPGHGIDATIQRVVLDGLDRAACRLHTNRERLVLSLGGKGPWDERTIDDALRAGLRGAVDDAGRRGEIPGFLLPVARRAIATLPLEKLIRGGIRLQDLLP